MALHRRSPRRTTATNFGRRASRARAASGRPRASTRRSARRSTATCCRTRRSRSAPARSMRGPFRRSRSAATATAPKPSATAGPRCRTAAQSFGIRRPPRTGAAGATATRGTCVTRGKVEATRIEIKAALASRSTSTGAMLYAGCPARGEQYSYDVERVHTAFDVAVAAEGPLPGSRREQRQRRRRLLEPGAARAPAVASGSPTGTATRGTRWRSSPSGCGDAVGPLDRARRRGQGGARAARRRDPPVQPVGPGLHGQKDRSHEGRRRRECARRGRRRRRALAQAARGEARARGEGGEAEGERRYRDGYKGELR